MAVAASKLRWLLQLLLSPKTRRLVRWAVALWALSKVYKMLKRLISPAAVQLLMKQTERNKRLVAACPSLGSYAPTPWLLNGHMQTLFAGAARAAPKGIKFTRNFADLDDGGHAALDWLEPFEANKPTLLILHGLTGGSNESYVQWMADSASKKGLQVVVMNARGCGGSGLSTPRSFSAAQTQDLGTVVRAVRQQVGDAPLFAIGYSLGAGILVKYLGERGRACGISAAVACCASYNMRITSAHMESFPVKQIYNRHLAGNLKRWLKGHEHIFRAVSWLNLDKVYAAETVRQFDEQAIVPQYGYDDVWHYYDDASSARVLPDVAIPLLIANAKDDPIAAWQGIPLEVVEDNSKVIIAITEEGGHVAWFQGWGAGGRTWDNHIATEFFDACMGDLEFLNDTNQLGFSPVGAGGPRRHSASYEAWHEDIDAGGPLEF